jgi:molecular chaperone HscC
MIIGIDLGTTNSLVSVWQDGRAVLIPNRLGSNLTPSCVSIDEDGSILVGQAAKERLQSHPDMSVAVFKRFMGSDKQIRIGKRHFRAEELSSFVLKALKADAEAFLGEAVNEAIITVPAYFSDAQRKATRTAGIMAGLQVDRLLNEPTAAALAYGMHQTAEEARFLVFDLGGGTFDVSILELFDGVMEVRASAGDNYLGGEDITQLIVERYFSQQQLDSKLRNDAIFMRRLSDAAERAKRALSQGEQAIVQMRIDNEERNLTLNEHDLEELCQPLLKRLRDPVERALRDTNIRPNNLDNIVLAGGATRMPMIKKLVTKMFGRFPASDLNPDEVVAMGAAVQAGLKMKDAALNEIVMTDVSPYSLGLEVSLTTPDNRTIYGHFSPIIERNTPVPVSRVKRYYPAEKNQTFLNLKIFQGEARLVKDNIFLGNLELSLPSKINEENGVDVRFTYDVNGLLEVQASIVATNETIVKIIQGNPGLLSDEEIQQRIQALSSLKLHPRDSLEVRTALARADRLYQQNKAEVRDWISQHISRFEAIVETQDNKLIAQHLKPFLEMLDQLERDQYLHPEQ